VSSIAASSNSSAEHEEQKQQKLNMHGKTAVPQNFSKVFPHGT